MASNGYPFITRNEVATRIASEPAFAVEAVRLIDERHGWMASHRPRASRLVARLAAGAPTAEDVAEAIALTMPYARTIARVLREKEMAERPELMGVAAVFGVVCPAAVPTERTTPVEAAPAPVVDKLEPTGAPVAPPKRRPGRPKGSKNRKPRSEPEQPKRRRPRS